MNNSADKGARQNRISPRIEEGADFYARLGVSHRASQAEITAAFRRLSRQYHPDAEGGGDSERMKLISEAYSTLKDPSKRAQYSPAHPSTFERGQSSFYDDIFRGGSNFEDLYADIFGRGRGGRTGFQNQNPDDLARSMGYRDFRHHMDESRRKKEERKTNPEIVKEEAVKKARSAAYQFESYVKELKEEGITNADNLINTKEVIDVILQSALAKARSAAYMYGSYIKDWEKLGFDRRQTDSHPELVALVLRESLQKAKSAPYLYGSYVKSWAEEGFDRKKADLNPDLINLISAELLSKAKSAAYVFESYLRNWKEENPNLDIKQLANSPVILEFVRTEAEKKKRSSEYSSESFLRGFREAGVNV